MCVSYISLGAEKPQIFYQLRNNLMSEIKQRRGRKGEVENRKAPNACNYRRDPRSG